MDFIKKITLQKYQLLMVVLFLSLSFFYCKKRNNTTEKSNITDSDLNIKAVKFLESPYNRAKIDNVNGIIEAFEYESPLWLHTDPLEDFELENPAASMVLLTSIENLNQVAEIEYLIGYQGKKKKYTLKINATHASSLRSLEIPAISDGDILIYEDDYYRNSKIKIYVNETQPFPVLQQNYAIPKNPKATVSYEATSKTYMITRRGYTRTYLVVFETVELCYRIKSFIVPNQQEATISGFSLQMIEGKNGETLTLAYQDFESYIHFHKPDSECTDRYIYHSYREGINHSSNLYFEIGQGLFNNPTKSYRYGLTIHIEGEHTFYLEDRVEQDKNLENQLGLQSEVLYAKIKNTQAQMDLVYDGDTPKLKLFPVNQNNRIYISPGGFIILDLRSDRKYYDLNSSVFDPTIHLKAHITVSSKIISVNGILLTADEIPLLETKNNEIQTLQNTTLTQSDFSFHPFATAQLSTTNNKDYQLIVQLGTKTRTYNITTVN